MCKIGKIVFGRIGARNETDVAGPLLDNHNAPVIDGQVHTWYIPGTYKYIPGTYRYRKLCSHGKWVFVQSDMLTLLQSSLEQWGLAVVTQLHTYFCWMRHFSCKECPLYRTNQLFRLTLQLQLFVVNTTHCLVEITLFILSNISEM
jgi:hypothetical protein